MATQFSHLAKLEVKGSTTAEFTLHALDGQPTLTVKPALESNTGYFNAALKGSRKNMRAIRAGNVSANMLDETRENDRALYAAHVLVSWDDIVDNAGKVVPFSREAAREFLTVLPSWVFDELREFCGTPSNFVAEAVVDAEDTAKN